MFDYLLDLPVRHLITGVYYALRLIKHSVDIQDIQRNLRIEGLPTEPSLEDEKLASQIVAEIERSEQTALRKLSEQKTAEYVRILSDIVQNVAKRELKYDEKRGRRLLQELRKDSEGVGRTLKADPRIFHDIVASRIAKKFGTEFNKRNGPDIITRNAVIEVVTAQTVREALMQLKGFRKPVYIAGVDQEAVNVALKRAKGTTIGVMDGQGNIVKSPSRKGYKKKSRKGGGIAMARRPGSPTYGKRFVGNKNKMEVHDLDNEKTGENECQIDEIIEAGHAVTFTPDTLSQAHSQGYDNCAYCIGGSRR